MASAGKGLPFIGKMNEFLNKVLHPTVQKAGNSRAAIDVINRGYYLIDSNPFTALSGSTDSLIKVTAHPFKVGDSLRLNTTTNTIIESEVIIDEIVDANTVKIAGYLSASLTAGDTFYCRRPTAELLATDGTRLSSIAYLRDGSAVSVSRDTVTPSNSKAFPVEIMGANGMVLNVTTGDINIQTNHADRTVNGVVVPGDSMRIGDGTDILLINTDGSVNSKISNGTITADIKPLGTQVVSTDNGLLVNSVIHGLTTGGGGGYVDVKVNPSGALTVESTVSSSVLPTGAATETTVAANNVLIGAVTETVPATDTASSGLNGRLQRIAQRLSSLITLFPTSLGQGTMATSMKVVLPSDQSAIAVTMAAVPTGGSTSALQSTGNISLGNLDTNIGAKADAAATTETGTFSLIALIKFLSANLSLMSAKLPTSLGIKTAANSLSVTPASDAVYSIKPKALTNTYDEYLTLTTVQTFTAPANAIGGKIMASGVNSDDVNYKQNGTATTTSGMQLSAGRSEDFMGGSNITVVSKTGTQAVMIQWTIQS